MSAIVIDLCGEGLCMKEATHRLRGVPGHSFLCIDHVAVLWTKAKAAGADLEALALMLQKLPSRAYSRCDVCGASPRTHACDEEACEPTTPETP